MTHRSDKSRPQMAAAYLSRLSLLGVAISMGLSMLSSAHAFSTSDQCDYYEPNRSNWQVTNVRSNDVLNMRRDPNPKSGKIHTLPYNARNIEVICCVKKAKGADWCLAQQSSTGKSGWISKHFVTQSYGSNTAKPRQSSHTSSGKRANSYVSKYINDNYARLLVEKMYREYGHVNTDSDRKFFRTFMHSQYLDEYLDNIYGQVPLYYTQDDYAITELTISNDPEYPTQNGNYYVKVSFVEDNHIYPVNIIYRLRVDNNQRLRIVGYKVDRF